MYALETRALGLHLSSAAFLYSGPELARPYGIATQWLWERVEDRGVCVLQAMGSQRAAHDLATEQPESGP